MFKINFKKVWVDQTGGTCRMPCCLSTVRTMAFYWYTNYNWAASMHETGKQEMHLGNEAWCWF